MLYFFMSVLKLTSERWLPIILDLGFGMSAAAQSISSEDRHRVGKYVTDILGTICGATQVVVQRGREEGLPRYESRL